MNGTLFIIPNLLGADGIAGYNRNLFRVLVDTDCPIKVLSRNDTNSYYDGFHIYCFGRFRSIFIRKLLFSLSFFWNIIFFSPDLVICGHSNFSALCIIANAIFKTKYIIVYHGTEAWNLNKIKNYAARKAVFIISVSRFTSKRLIEQMPELNGKIKLLPNSVNGELFYPEEKPEYLMQRHGFSKTDKIILTVARLQVGARDKGYYRVLEVLPKIISFIPEAKYILAGEGDDLGNLIDFAKKMNIQDKVIFTGYIPDSELRDYYNLCDVFVMPSKKEGFGIVYLEALACGKIVIAGNKDGSEEPLLYGEIGILIDPDNPDDIESTIVKAIKKDLPERLLDGSYLRAKVLEAYGFNRFKSNVSSIFAKVAP